MKNLHNYIFQLSFKSVIKILLLTVIFSSCSEDILEEQPLDFLSPEGILTNKSGFETAITALHAGVRNGYFQNDGVQTNFFAHHPGTDIAISTSDWGDYEVWLTPTRNTVEYFWNWVYRDVLPRANIIIEYAERPEAVWADDAEKNAIVAEARFFRAFGHNILANLYGGVPIVQQVFTEPKLDFVRSTREEVLAFVAEDLEFAAEWLPETASLPGRITKAAANHLLAEVYISLGRYDDAISRASAVIDGGIHSLMTTRFGSRADEPGDVYADLFRTGNQNLGENTETIWALQVEPITVPGGGQYRAVRYWNPNFPAIRDPNNEAGLQFTDSTNRPQGFIRGTHHLYQTVWNADPDDMRNSRFNIRRTITYNLPSSAFFGQIVDPATAINIDTVRNYWPFLTKAEGESQLGPFTGFVEKDIYMMRLAETYLLRAEAYLMKGELQSAADDINVIRARANAEPATAAQMNIDYILDERMRELTLEEPRRLTLARTGTLVDRVRRYSNFSVNVRDHHRFFPIPQTAIDANINAELEQNPGYPGAN